MKSTRHGYPDLDTRVDTDGDFIPDALPQPLGDNDFEYNQHE